MSTNPGSFIELLRATTKSEHSALERTPMMASLMNKNLSVADYTQVLLVFARLYATLDPLLIAATRNCQVLDEGHQYHARLPFLQRDLSALRKRLNSNLDWQPATLASDKKVLSGLLAVPMSAEGDRHAWLLFFRTEQVEIKRWGGEEFLLLATETAAAEAIELAEHIRAAIEKINEPELPQVTVSIGVAEFNGSKKWDSVVDRADKAMYAAKQKGRNQVVA